MEHYVGLDVSLKLTAICIASASRPSGEWNEDDFDVLADGVVVGRIFKANASPSAPPGCGRWPLGIRRTAHRRTEMRQHGTPLCRRSLGAGAESKAR
jgi:hypothetical protein